MNREEWFAKALERIRPRFEATDHALPEKVRVSVGWPGGRGPKRNVIGQCWFSESVSDGVPALFISPALSNPVDVLVTLTHEFVHACGKRGHRKEFSDLAKAVGLEKPWKSTPAGEELKEFLTELATELGPYDHGSIASIGITRQSTRLLKVSCPSCGYVIRVTRKWIDKGLPTCYCGTEMEEAEV